MFLIKITNKPEVTAVFGREDILHEHSFTSLFIGIKHPPSSIASTQTDHNGRLKFPPR